METKIKYSRELKKLHKGNFKGELNVNKGIIQYGGKMENPQNVNGDKNKIVQNIKKDKKVINEEKRDTECDLEAINRKLEDLNSELSKHKDSLDEFFKKTLILESELKEEKPLKEGIKRRLEELSLLSFQISGTANSLFQVFSGLK